MKLVATLLLLFLPGSAASADWPGFRGDGSSVGLGSPPLDWSIETGRNVDWSADLPGRGVSGPVVVGDRVLVTASDGPNRERLYVVAFDAGTGRQLWERRFWATGRTNCHPVSANAAPTPASDGERVFAFYSSNDLVCLRLDGSVAWVRGLALNHPGVGNDIGMASSPVVAGGAVVVQAECQGDSFALAVDRRTGKTLWEVERPKRSNWASPLAWTTPDGKPAVWLQDGQGASLHDAATGERVTRIELPCGGIASPTAAGEGQLLLPAEGVCLFGPPFAEPLQRAPGLKPVNASPIVVGSRVLVVNRGGVLVCAELATGETLWRSRIGGSYWATPIVVGGRAYCANSKGEVTVVDIEDGAVLAKSPFGEGIYGSPAVAGGALYFRSHAHLWRISATAQAALPKPSPR